MSAEDGYRAIPATKGVGVLATAVVTTLGIALYGGTLDNDEWRAPRAALELTPSETPFGGPPAPVDGAPADIAALRSEGGTP
ncbi:MULTISPECIES: hypothetical protein [Mycobacteriaceae]|uniref:Uncharacterized protein n=1 Tax=Mycolicibacterium neoaurum VKM Ac-1815D TaxID=700508 RepID=V5XJA4_MYCNE|nr:MULTISPECIES: hypothetical protein [Mycobacteriaceae]AHC28013.1 hypothetical protein D174_18645 [Mycolicibacterium neoaurum VKM Ac-1815D]AMO06791.1 hypothetical protein MyAD_18285 [Mycolicibacterium neoaurum]AXK74841.1 hypothetical protein DXK33_06655 [Mycolicibacterium neoaurum]KJQ49031.1 hypothetical protein TS71_17640 [Mycolicibacterium neoaurum]KUM08167.1 hypothetical protein AVZ31_13055 [Mycolicibacterium neoaurum]